MGEHKGVWVYLERRDNRIFEPSLEVLSKAKELSDKLGEEVTGVLLGYKGLEDLAMEAIWFGADHVYAVRNLILDNYFTVPYAQALANLLTQQMPNMLLFSATRNGRDLAGRISAKLGLGLMANIVWADVTEEGTLLGGVPGFGGSIMAITRCLSKPQMATVRPGVFKKRKPDKSRKGIVELLEMKDLKKPDVRIIEHKTYEVEDIGRAEAIVIAGRGVADNLDLAKKLAENLGWAFGVSRPISDQGLAPRDIYVGSTGKTVRPKIALIVGVSGAAHFISGVIESEKIVAINTDPEAPIIEYSDYYAVEDAAKLLPLLLKKLRRSES